MPCGEGGQTYTKYRRRSECAWETVMRKSEWGIEIKRVANGFSIKNNDGEVTVIEEKDDDVVPAAEALLWHVIEFFNLGGTRYDKERVRVVREPGDKYEPPQEGV